MIRRTLLFLTVLLYSLLSFAASKNRSPYLTIPHKDHIQDLDNIPPIPPNAPGFIPVYGELDEILGDTLFVGNTYWESRHNGTVGRMIGLQPDRPGLAQLPRFKM